jgi:ribosomal protein L29
MLKKIIIVREEAATLKRNMHMGDVQNVRAYSFKRKELARMLTELNKMKAEEKK